MALDPKIVLYVLGALVAVAGIAAYSRSDRKVLGIHKGIVGTFLVLVAGLLVFGLGTGSLTAIGIQPLAAGTSAGTSSDAGDSGVEPMKIGDTTILCAVEDTTVTLSAENAYTAVASGGTHRYRLNGRPALTAADAGSFTASPGDKYEVLWYNASANGAYFSAITKGEVPCKGTFVPGVDGMPVKLYQNGTITIDVFNRDGQRIDGGENNQTFASGDTFTLNARLTGQYQRGFTYGGVIVAEFNDTEFDDVIVNFGGQKTNNPDFFAVGNTDFSARSYTVPALLSNAEVSGTVYADADDTNNPTTTSDIVLRFYPNNIFIDDDNGGAFAGPAVEDEDDVQAYSHVTSYTIHVT